MIETIMQKYLAYLSTLLLALPGIALAADADIVCPPMPAAVTDITHDVQLDIKTNIGSLGKFKAGELVAKGNVVAHSVYEKHPDVPKILLTQTMSATYCSMLRSANFTGKQRADRWNTFQTKVLGLSTDSQTSAKSTTPSTAANFAPTTEGNARQEADISTAARNTKKKTALDKLIESLSGGGVRFQVGTDQLDARSTTYLQAVATHLRRFDNVSIRLEPIRSKAVEGDGFSSDARALYASRQQQVRQVLVHGGFASDQIIFVNDTLLGNSSDDVYDAAGHPIEFGLAVNISTGGD